MHQPCTPSLHFTVPDGVPSVPYYYCTCTIPPTPRICLPQVRWIFCTCTRHKMISTPLLGSIQVFHPSILDLGFPKTMAAWYGTVLYCTYLTVVAVAIRLDLRFPSLSLYTHHRWEHMKSPAAIFPRTPHHFQPLYAPHNQG